MNVYFSPRHVISMLAALVLAAALTFMPNASAFADEVNAGQGNAFKITYQNAAPQDSALLRRLLSNPELNVEQQLLLEHTMDGVFEELADASPVQAPPQNKGIIQSVNDLLGVKTANGAQAKG